MSTASPDLVITGGTVPVLPVPGAAAGFGAASQYDDVADATAVALTGDRITAVGGEEVAALAGPGTRVVDAAGGAILPGINDAHLHFIASAYSRYCLAPLGSARDWDGVAALLEALEPGADGWIRAHGWDAAVLGDGGTGRVAAARPDAPVVAYDQTGHQLLLNRTAMDRLGLHGAADVTGGTVTRDVDGAPTGHFADAAMGLAGAGIPELPRESLRSAVLRHQADLHALGITSLTEPGLGPGGASLLSGACTASALELLADLAEAGDLTMRITALMLFSGTGGATAEATRRGLDSGLPRLLDGRGIDPLQLRIGGVKVFADGTPRSGSAWMKDTYRTPCGHHHGHLVIAGATDAERVEELNGIIAAIHGAGLQAGVHATGDAATAAVVDAIAAATAAAPRDARHYVIHGAFADDDALRRLGEHRVGYSTNPAIRSAAGRLMLGVLGGERFARHQPLTSALAAGIPANIASDAPVTSPDWRHSVVAAATRDTTAGPGGDDDERLALRTALALMTGTPAWQDHAERHKGRVAAGQLADLCVLAGPLPGDPRELLENPTALTVAGGRIVHRREP
ncbi:amidohydrolase [Zhihengliuella salsuginis]|uniref:Amidohydrolase n=1 Tax=Zhihengliuella salsuginis TaxID=578222 RepID=A0ABQ3GIT1_9MICC|nr:amidohydrolase family protein [Zhihengliuella salsuginis]GHD05955.1 amidohydrolase [Zhihengliuella salsuginis]